MTRSLPTISRRRLLKAALSSPALTLGAPFLGALAAAGTAQAAHPTGYKALVCIFLEGGNDHWNTVVPYDHESYLKYASIRGGKAHGLYAGISVRREQLLPLVPAPGSPGSGDGFRHALHPMLPSIAAMFDGTFGGSGRRLASVALNVGPLREPTVIRNGRRQAGRLPARLFSHNDQQALAQSIVGTEGARSGWAGRVMDHFFQEGTLGGIAVGQTPSALWLSGSEKAFGIGVGDDSAPTLPGLSSGEWACYDRMMQAARYQNPLMKDVCLIDDRSRRAVHTLARQIEAAKQEVDGYFSGVDGSDDGDPNPLGVRLRMVARLIHANRHSSQRQVFLVSLGGFDTHSGLTDRHPRLLAQLDEAVSKFFKAVEGMQALDKVTAFTASEFGRALWSNGNGSDHGWGAHHFVFSGAPSFSGGQFVGESPDIRAWTRADSDAGKGRLIPTTSLEQFAYPIARWFGLPEGDPVDTVFPNLKTFAQAGPLELFDTRSVRAGPI